MNRLNPLGGGRVTMSWRWWVADSEWSWIMDGAVDVDCWWWRGSAVATGAVLQVPTGR